MDECLFCKIVAGGIPSYKVYEDEEVIAFLDIFPATHGHTLVLPKKHVQQLKDLSKEERAHLLTIATMLADNLVKKGFGEAVNYVCNDGPVAGQEIPHTHIHLIPRNPNDGFGFKKPNTDQASDDELSRTAEQLQTK